jgi:hypothetical protein
MIKENSLSERLRKNRLLYLSLRCNPDRKRDEYPPKFERRFNMRTFRIVTVAAFVWLTAAGLAMRGQISQFPSPTQGTTQTGRTPTTKSSNEPADIPPAIADEQARSRNSERQKKLEEDTDRLLSLARELKEQVGKTNKNIMSVDVIKKADEIEKLAKSVKERMKG